MWRCHQSSLVFWYTTMITYLRITILYERKNEVSYLFGVVTVHAIFIKLISQLVTFLASFFVNTVSLNLL